MKTELKWKILDVTNVCDNELNFMLPVSCMKKIYGENIVFLVCQEDNRPIAYFYYFRKNISQVVLKIQPPPFLPYNELHITKPLPENPSKRNTFLKHLHFSLIQFLKCMPQRSIITLCFPPDFVDMQVFYWENFKVIPYYTYQINLLQDMEKIFSGFTPEKRNVIRKAQKDGLFIEKGTTQDILKFATNTFLRKKVQVHRSIIERFFRHLPEERFFVFNCFNNDNIKIASAGFLTKDEKVYYLFSGFDKEYNHNGSISLLLYHAMLHFKEQGMKIFDFEGSMLKDVEKNIRDFGGDLVPYFSVNSAALFVEIVLKFFFKNRF